MPLGLEALCKRILDEIVTTSHAIDRSALALANNAQNLDVSKRLRFQLETIRISADTILEAITEASLTEYTIDDRLANWLISGELPSCLAKLKEIDDMLKPSTGHATLSLQPLSRPASEDKLTSAMALFERHKIMFRFLATPDVWNHERLRHQPPTSEAPRVGALPVPGCHCQESSVTSTINIVDGSSSNANEEPTLRRQTDSHRQMLEEVVRWLTALDCTDKHNHMIQLRQKGTCKWFPKTDAYRKWKSHGAQFLWLHGKAGCGKSVLIASTIEHLKTELRLEEVVVFFYFDFQNARSRSPTEMMRSLLFQLCCHLLDLRVHPLDIPSNILEQKKKGSLSLDDLDKLSDFASRVANCFIREPIVVIVALDECADTESLLRALVNLNLDGKVRLVVTSRPHQDMIRHFAKLPSLSYEDMAEELAADIELHIEREVSLHSRLKFADKEMKNEIHTKLNQKAEGRFRWVQCQLDVLNQCTTAVEAREVLDSLPTELEATYERILDEIDERRMEGQLARRVLVYLTVALEPLRLVQILDALSIDFSLPRKIIHGTPSPRAELLNMLSSLVTHYKETDVMSLSHFTVKEFLTSRTTLPMYQIVPCEAHAEAVRSCMRYISTFIKQGPSRRNAAPSESWPMLSYVLSFGLSHLAHVDPESTEVLEALQTLGADYPPRPSSRHDFVLYILIAYASTELFQTFLFRHNPLKPRVGTNPLVYAADLRKTNYGIALLACGADVDARGLAIDDSHHISPLEVSIDRDDVVLVNELLQRGCLVTSQLLSYTVCLPWCSARVLVQLMQTDEFVEWAHAIGEEKLYRGVFNGARPNRGDVYKTDVDLVALARRLRQIGQDISADSRFGTELIERALHAAYILMLEYLLPPDQPPPARFLLLASTGDTSETVSVVRFLLEKGVDTNVVSDGSRDTVLHLAARCPWEPRSMELTKMFTDAGCSPYKPNSWNETPLFIAAERKYLIVVEHLLSSNIPIPSNTLTIALEKCLAPQIIQSIVRKGADMNSRFNGETVLNLAINGYSESACLELMKSFIEAGCDPTTCVESVLHTAIKREYTSAIDLLLSYDVVLPPDILPIALKKHLAPQIIQTMVRKGADVNSMLNGEIVLDLAIKRYGEPTCLGLMKTFIGAGYDPITRNSKGGSALYTAIRYKYISVVKFLLLCRPSLPPDLFRTVNSTMSNEESRPQTWDDKQFIDAKNEYRAGMEKVILSGIPISFDILPIALELRLAPQFIRTIVHGGGDVNFTLNGKTVLDLAIAQYSEPACVELTEIFIEAGWDPITCNSKGESALHTAIRYKYISVAKLLLPYHVSLPPDVLPIAPEKGFAPQIIQTMVHKGADVNSTLKGKTILHLVINQYGEPMCLELTKSFIEAGWDPTACDSNGKTALHTAAERGYISVAELLLSHHVPLPPDILPITLQNTPYMNPQMIQFLIRKGADVNSMLNGKTVLHLAIKNQYSEPTCLELTKSFIKAGWDPTVCSSDGETTLHTATSRNYIYVAELLLSHHVLLPPDILQTTLQDNPYTDLRMIQFLIRKGADVNATLDGKTVLHLAMNGSSESICLELVKYFIEAGCNPITRDSKGESALSTSIKRAYMSVAGLLLSYPIDKGTETNSTTGTRKTVLHRAVMNHKESDRLQLVKGFIEAGCDPTSCKWTNATALEFAIKYNTPSVALCLLGHCDLPLPSDILPTALRQRSAPRENQLLVSRGAQIHWHDIAELVDASYTGRNYQEVIEILNTARKRKMRDRSPEDMAILLRG